MGLGCRVLDVNRWMEAAVGRAAGSEDGDGCKRYLENGGGSRETLRLLSRRTQGEFDV